MAGRVTILRPRRRVARRSGFRSKVYALGTTGIATRAIASCQAFVPNTDRGTRQTPGVADLVAFVPRLPKHVGGSRQLWVECKAGSGRMTPEQQAQLPGVEKYEDAKRQPKDPNAKAAGSETGDEKPEDPQDAKRREEKRAAAGGKRDGRQLSGAGKGTRDPGAAPLPNAEK